MLWKDIVVMDEQTLEAQGVAGLSARKKMLNTFEVVRKIGIEIRPSLPFLHTRPSPYVCLYY